MILDRNTLNEDIESTLKFYPDINRDKAMEIIKLDPTYKEGRNSLGTYGKWLLNLYKKKALKDEDFYKVPDYLKSFENKKKWFTNKDIGQFKSLGDLAQALDNVEVGELSQNQKDKQAKREYQKAELNADKLYEDDNWVIYIPKDYNSSCKLATNTEWCTGPSSHGDSRYYDMYSKEGPLYILINKKDNEEKYQLHFPSKQFMDRYDRPFTIDDTSNRELEGVVKYFLNKEPNESISILGCFSLDGILDEDLRDELREKIANDKTIVNLFGDKGYITLDIDESIEFRDTMDKWIQACIDGDVWEFMDSSYYYDFNTQDEVTYLLGNDGLEEIKSTYGVNLKDDEDWENLDDECKDELNQIIGDYQMNADSQAYVDDFVNNVNYVLDREFMGHVESIQTGESDSGYQNKIVIGKDEFIKFENLPDMVNDITNEYDSNGLSISGIEWYCKQNTGNCYLSDNVYGNIDKDDIRGELLAIIKYYLKDNEPKEESLHEDLSMKRFLNNEPNVGPHFITKDGKFLRCPGDTHTTIKDFDEFKEYKERSAGLDDIIRGEGLIRVNDGSILENEVYIQLPNDKLNDAQLNALEKYIDYVYNLNNSYGISIEILDSQEYQYYVFDDFEINPDYIMKRIKNWNSSGMLRESNEKMSMQEIIDRLEHDLGTTDYKVEGPSYILPNGKFLKIWGANVDIQGMSGSQSKSGKAMHLDVDGYMDKKLHQWGENFYINKVCIRVNNGFEQYVVLPLERPNEQQYKSLTYWIDRFCLSHDRLTVMDWYGSSLNCKYYNVKEVMTDDIIKKIKRYYTTGELVESLNDDDFEWLDEVVPSVETLSDFSDICKYISKEEESKIKEYIEKAKENARSPEVGNRVALQNELSSEVEPYLDSLIDKYLNKANWEVPSEGQIKINHSNLKQYFNKFIDSRSDEEIIEICGLKTQEHVSKEGPQFVLSNGKIINGLDNGSSETHAYTLAYIFDKIFEHEFGNRFIEDYYDYTIEDLGLMDHLTYDRGWMRINPGTREVEDRFYCVLPNEMTPNHYAKLDEFLFLGETSNNKEVLIFATSYRDKHTYSFRDNTSTEILKKVKRYYTTNVFVESLKDRVYYTPKEEKEFNKSYLDSYHYEVIDLKDIIDKEDLITKAQNHPKDWGKDTTQYKIDSIKQQDWMYSPIRYSHRSGLIDGKHRLVSLYNNGYNKAEILVRNESLKEGLKNDSYLEFDRVIKKIDEWGALTNDVDGSVLILFEDGEVAQCEKIGYDYHAGLMGDIQYSITQEDNPDMDMDNVEILDDEILEDAYDLLGVITLNDGKFLDDRCKVVMNGMPTSSQFEQLTKWLDRIQNESNEVIVYCNRLQHTYDFKDLISKGESPTDYIIKSIKDSFRSGILESNENEFTITVYTYQSQEVVDQLTQGKTYIANPSKGMFGDKPHYKELQRILGLKHSPIFGGIDKDEVYDMMEASGLTTSNRTHLLTLEVPSSEVHRMSFYDWSDYIYYWIDKQEEDTLTQEEAEDTLRHCGDTGLCQVVIDRIEPEWVVDDENSSSENPFSKEELEKDLDDIEAWSKEWLSQHQKEFDDWKKSLQEKIVKKGSKWQVQSEKGKNMGTYDTKAEAEKRLQQVHYFKYKNEDMNVREPWDDSWYRAYKTKYGVFSTDGRYGSNDFTWATNDLDYLDFVEEDEHVAKLKLKPCKLLFYNQSQEEWDTLVKKYGNIGENDIFDTINPSDFEIKLLNDEGFDGFLDGTVLFVKKELLEVENDNIDLLNESKVY